MERRLYTGTKRIGYNGGVRILGLTVLAVKERDVHEGRYKLAIVKPNEILAGSRGGRISLHKRIKYMQDCKATCKS